jgi:protein SCO1/2
VSALTEYSRIGVVVRHFGIALLAAALLATASPAFAQPAAEGEVKEIGLDPISFRGPDPKDRFKDIKIQQNLGAEVPLDLTFTNEKGEEVKLADYFDDRPVVLSMVYYGCPMLCTLVLNGMVASFDGMAAGAGSSSGDYDLGRDYTVISVSINPDETPELAAEKKANYLADLHIDGAAENWHFLTGSQENIEILAETIGFRYYYDEPSGQYAHDSGVMVLTPKGKVSSYYLGIEYLPKNLRTAMEVAATDTIGEYLQQPTLLCFAYDPTKGVYGLVIMSTLRLGGILTVLLIVAFWIVNYLRARRAAEAEHKGTQTGTPSPAGWPGGA